MLWLHRPAAWMPATSAQPGTLHALEIGRAVQKILDDADDPILVVDGGEFGQWAQACMSASTRIINGPAGSIGSAIPFALAARVARPNATVVAVLGDGTFGFHMAERTLPHGICPSCWPPSASAASSGPRRSAWGRCRRASPTWGWQWTWPRTTSTSSSTSCAATSRGSTRRAGRSVRRPRGSPHVPAALRRRRTVRHARRELAHTREAPRADDPRRGRDAARVLSHPGRVVRGVGHHADRLGRAGAGARRRRGRRRALRPAQGRAAARRARGVRRLRARRHARAGDPRAKAPGPWRPRWPCSSRRARARRSGGRSPRGVLTPGAITGAGPHRRASSDVSIERHRRHLALNVPG